MLVNFTVGNFLSFRDKKTLSLEAAPIKDNGSQIIEVGKHQILPSAALYGANSSGKSNFLVPDRRRNAFSCSLLSVILTVGLSYMALIMLNFIFSVHSLLGFLILNAC